MSVHRIEPNGSVVWRVRWREGGRGSRSRMRAFDRKSDAAAYEDELCRCRRLGELGLMPGSQETLDEYVCQTWAQHAVTLAPKTAKHYAGLYETRAHRTVRLFGPLQDDLRAWQSYCGTPAAGTEGASEAPLGHV